MNKCCLFLYTVYTLPTCESRSVLKGSYPSRTTAFTNSVLVISLGLVKKIIQ